jgi:tetratricopeptide (TPR) repeat protein
MELSEKDMALLDAYKSGILSLDDKKSLEKRFQDDSAFKIEAHNYWAMMAALDGVGDWRTEQFLKDIDKTMPPYAPPSSLNWGIISLIVLGLLLSALGIWYFYIKEPPKPQLKPIVAAHFQPLDAYGILKGEENVKTNALSVYALNHFEKAIPLLQKAFDIEKDSLLLLYQGISYIGNGESEKALPVLNSLKASDALPEEFIVWYMALAYIEMGEEKKALPLLEKVAVTEGENKGKAIEILKKL